MNLASEVAQCGTFDVSSAPCVPTTATKIDGTSFYYCWSHGLSTIAAHTGHTCGQPKTGHIPAATVFDCKGGSNTFSTR